MAEKYNDDVEDMMEDVLGVEDDGGMSEDDEPMEMTDEELSAILKSAIDDATDYIDTHVAPQRALATAYYRGDPFGNEEEGRSQVVMTEVRDTVQTMIPELLRIFCMTDSPVMFEPNTAEAVSEAEQATDYINHIVMQENNGVKLFYDVFKDALVRKTGIVKWMVDETEEVTEEDYSNLSADQYMMLIQDPQIGPDNEVEYFERIDPETGDVAIDCRVRRVNTNRRFVVEAIPPEEFFCSRNARDIDTADCVGHRRFVTLSELVAMGYSEEDIRENGAGATNFVFNDEAQARNPALRQYGRGVRQEMEDPAMARYEYFETYIRLDKDKDGIVELRKVCSIGGGHYVLHDEVVPEVPMAVFCPDPEPHMMIGQSVADQVMDLQRIKTSVVRNTLDSLAQNINPRTVILDGAVNIDDVMNTETGAIIRARVPGAVQPLVEPFVGQYALPIIKYLDDVRASRTGITKASAGLDPDVLQSTTKSAVTATVTAAQQRIELVARIFAETGMRRLFAGLLRLVVRAQDKPRVFKLRGQWIEVDPRSWNVGMRLTVNVGLGSGDKQEKLAFLQQVAAKQEQMILTLGPVNPLTDIKKYRYTLGKIIELAGHKDVGNFLNDITDQQLQQMQQSAATKKKKPTPEEVLAQIEQMKAQKDMAIQEQKQQLEAAKAKMSDDRERDRIEADALIRIAELELKYGQPVNAQLITSRIDRKRGDMNGA